jgi:hypothetical protein
MFNSKLAFTDKEQQRWTPEIEEAFGLLFRKECSTWRRQAEGSPFPSMKHDIHKQRRTVRGDQIIRVLEATNEPLTALQIARRCGFNDSAKVRHILYIFLRDLRVVRANKGKDCSTFNQTFLRGPTEQVPLSKSWGVWPSAV